jgi:hypothetical protein
VGATGTRIGLGAENVRVVVDDVKKTRGDTPLTT